MMMMMMMMSILTSPSLLPALSNSYTPRFLLPSPSLSHYNHIYLI
jgi:hypothetical protein